MYLSLQPKLYSAGNFLYILNKYIVLKTTKTKVSSFSFFFFLKQIPENTYFGTT